LPQAQHKATSPTRKPLYAMTYTLETHKWIIDEKKHLGFVGINIYQNPKNEFDIMESINQGLLIDGHFAREIEMNPTPSAVYGAINLDGLEESDFIECDNQKLEDCYNKYWSDNNWGADLDVFKKHKILVDDYLKDINFHSDRHFFICQEWLSKDKYVNLNFFAYLVCVISISSDKIAVITYGED
jgi:hypothetical protein